MQLSRHADEIRRLRAHDRYLLSHRARGHSEVRLAEVTDDGLAERHRLDRRARRTTPRPTWSTTTSARSYTTRASLLVIPSTSANSNATPSARSRIDRLEHVVRECPSSDGRSARARSPGRCCRWRAGTHSSISTLAYGRNSARPGESVRQIGIEVEDSLRRRARTCAPYAGAYGRLAVRTPPGTRRDRPVRLRRHVATPHVVALERHDDSGYRAGAGAGRREPERPRGRERAAEVEVHDVEPTRRAHSSARRRRSSVSRPSPGRRSTSSVSYPYGDSASVIAYCRARAPLRVGQRGRVTTDGRPGSGGREAGRLSARLARRSRPCRARRSRASATSRRRPDRGIAEVAPELDGRRTSAGGRLPRASGDAWRSGTRPTRGAWDETAR